MADMYRFLVDSNVGKLARWLRLMGYDAVFFNSGDDTSLVRQALQEERILLTRDTGIMRRRVIATGMLRAVYFKTDCAIDQMHQLVTKLNLDTLRQPFSICLECNTPLMPTCLENVKNRIPPYVKQTQQEFSECPLCHRIYWKGTHYAAMLKRLSEFKKANAEQFYNQ